MARKADLRAFRTKAARSRPVRINLVILGGSRAFGTAFPDCDWDYYGVFSYPLPQVVSLYPGRESYSWQAGDMDFSGCHERLDGGREER